MSQQELFIDGKTGDGFNLYKDNLKNVIVFVAGGGSYYEYECMKKLEDETKL